MYLLDTNILTEYLEGNTTIEEKVANHILDDNEIKVDGIAYYEQKRGLLNKGLNKELERLETFTVMTDGIKTYNSLEIFDRAAKIYVHLMNIGRPTGSGLEKDILIGALALEKGYTVVTDNEKHFRPMPDVEFENWLEPSTE